jgi:hypothetical protein
VQQLGSFQHSRPRAVITSSQVCVKHPACSYLPSSQYGRTPPIIAPLDESFLTTRTSHTAIERARWHAAHVRISPVCPLYFLPLNALLTQNVTAPAFDPFIVTTSLDKTDAETRKFIRSHVMRGKNKGKSMPRKGKKSRSPDSDTTPQSSPASLVQHEDSGWEHWQLVSPRKVASELSLFRYTQELNPSMKELIFRGSSSRPCSLASSLC